MSTILFCLVLDSILIDLRKEGFQCVAFADDVALISDKKVDLDRVKEIYARFGLEVNLDKCKSTSNGENVVFLG